MLILNIADIKAQVESDCEEFIKEVKNEFKPFLINQAFLPHFRIKVNVKNNWKNPVKITLNIFYNKISKSELRVRDNFLKFNGYFNFISNQGEIFIENYWQEVLMFFLIRIYTYYLLKNEGFFLHSSCAVKNNTSFVFLGGSGFGKTTISNELALKGYTILNDDLICVRKIKNTYKIFTHPFKRSSICLNKNFSVDAHNLFFLKKCRQSNIEKICAVECFNELLRYIYEVRNYEFRKFFDFFLRENFNTACNLIKDVKTFKFNFSYYDRQWSDLF